LQGGFQILFYRNFHDDEGIFILNAFALALSGIRIAEKVAACYHRGIGVFHAVYFGLVIAAN
jgi:hypothetical protein